MEVFSKQQRLFEEYLIFKYFQKASADIMIRSPIYCLMIFCTAW